MDVETAEQITDADCAEMARLIAEGNTSGIIDREGFCISWSLNAEIFEN